MSLATGRFEPHSHTMYSNTKFVDSLNKPKELIDRAVQLGLSGIAITDHSCIGAHVVANQYGLEVQKDHPGFKVALGEESYLCETRDKNQYYYHQIFIAKNKVGHKMLRELSSMSWEKGYHDRGIFRTPILYEEVEDLIKKYGRGNLIAQSACFRKGTKVLSKNGYIPIENVVSGTELMNQDGEWEPTIIPTQIGYTGTGYKITTRRSGGCDPIVCSSDHKFLVVNPNSFSYARKVQKKPCSKWMDAKELYQARKQNGNTLKLIRPMLPIKYDIQKSFIYKDEWSLKSTSAGKRKFHLPDKIVVTPELMRLFGLFLGDGSIDCNQKRIAFCFHEDEFPYYWDDFVKKIEDQLGIKWSIVRRPKNHRVDIACNALDFFELFYYLFGNVRGDTKKIPERILHISKELDMELLFGYELADGYFQSTAGFKNDMVHKSGRMVSASISKDLTKGILELLDSLRITYSTWLSEGRIGADNVHHRPAWYIQVKNPEFGISWNKGQHNPHEEVVQRFYLLIANNEKSFATDKNTNISYCMVPIKEMEELRLNETLYCLMNQSHSFVCEGVVAHNCLAGTVNHNLLLMIRAEERGDEVARKTHHGKIVKYMRWMDKWFGDDFYLEVAPGRGKDQMDVNARMLSVANAFKKKIVIGTDSHYLSPSERDAHKVFLNAKSSSDREVDDFYYYAYLQSDDECREHLDGTGIDFDACLLNSLEEHEKIEDYSLFHTQQVPKISVPDYPKKKVDTGYPTIDYLYSSDEVQERYWVNTCVDELDKRGLHNDLYMSRLEEEADIQKVVGDKLDTCMFSYPVFLQHYIDLIWECGSTVGAGRGSACSGLSHFLLGVTQLDPVKNNLPFWRYMNKATEGLGDIDIDICPSLREKIFDKIKEERGVLGCVQVCTYGTVGSRSAVLNACRGYRSKEFPSGIDNDIAQYITSLIPTERGFTYSISDMVDGNEEKDRKPNKTFINEVNKYQGLLETIKTIEGVIDHVG